MMCDSRRSCLEDTQRREEEEAYASAWNLGVEDDGVKMCVTSYDLRPTLLDDDLDDQVFFLGISTSLSP